MKTSPRSHPRGSMQITLHICALRYDGFSSQPEVAFGGIRPIIAADYVSKVRYM
ncbi:hypothetical protein JMJ77_0012575 [Colletotrichum scovillei]|uniref:Uncharacterized protein n=1 Tax=Colletotrichum scovillei TaxID=1209932 RepID=A0A9P7UEN6_9PEZI|nr:hypothetical protein JMJ77_0012575 [Colletotrichum scovillei]KAG7068853.1 hypothetical protein JMJ76_0002533 [Colletotrichum scovillei]KAG7072809.1 hypothetical protein JMJ78_0013794 [Colletotrichum scovillei]